MTLDAKTTLTASGTTTASTALTMKSDTGLIMDPTFTGAEQGYELTSLCYNNKFIMIVFSVLTDDVRDNQKSERTEAKSTTAGNIIFETLPNKYMIYSFCVRRECFLTCGLQAKT